MYMHEAYGKGAWGGGERAPLRGPPRHKQRRIASKHRLRSETPAEAPSFRPSKSRPHQESRGAFSRCTARTRRCRTSPCPSRRLLPASSHPATCNLRGERSMTNSSDHGDLPPPIRAQVQAQQECLPQVEWKRTELQIRVIRGDTPSLFLCAITPFRSTGTCRRPHSCFVAARDLPPSIIVYMIIFNVFFNVY